MKKTTIALWLLCLVLCGALGVGATIFLPDRNAVYIRDAAGRGVSDANVSLLPLWNRWEKVSIATDGRGRANFGPQMSVREGKFLSVKVTKANDVLFDGVIEVPTLKRIVVIIDPLSKQTPIMCGAPL